jgi:hypothetical protein
MGPLQVREMGPLQVREMGTLQVREMGTLQVREMGTLWEIYLAYKFLYPPVAFIIIIYKKKNRVFINGSSHTRLRDTKEWRQIS